MADPFRKSKLRQFFSGLGWTPYSGPSRSYDPDEEDEDEEEEDEDKGEMSDEEFDALDDFPPRDGLFAGRH